MKLFLHWIGYDDSLELKNKFTYIIDGFCVGLVLAFLPVYVFMIRSPVISLATVLCLIILIVSFPFLKRRRFLVAKIIMLIGFFYQVTALALFWFPREANFNYFYFIVAPIVFFILDFRILSERRAIIASCSLAVLLLVLSEVSDYPEPLITPPEILITVLSAMSVISTIGSMSLVFFFYATNLAEIHGKLNTLADTDSLTKAYNRRTLDREGRLLFHRTERIGGHFDLILLDIDHFKTINDTYGHPAGDAILQELSRLITSKIRKDDILARYGGEEFAVLLANASPDGNHRAAGHLRECIENHAFVLPDGTTVNITVSIGVTEYHRDYGDFDAMIHAADKALYKAKENGRNRVESVDISAGGTE